MRRCVSAKVVRYYNDGTGRDTFIQRFNGGFQSAQLLLDNMPKQPENPLNPQWKVGGVTLRPTSAGTLGYVNYQSDGSGRDSYIHRNNGGLYNIETNTLNFLDYLRKSEARPLRLVPRGAFAKRLRERALKQRNESVRLSRPKTPLLVRCCVGHPCG